MLEVLLALFLVGAPGTPFSWVPVDSFVAVVGKVGNGWDPNGQSGEPKPEISGPNSETGVYPDVGNGWDPNG